MAEPECTCTFTRDTSDFDPACFYHGDNGTMVVVIDKEMFAPLSRPGQNGTVTSGRTPDARQPRQPHMTDAQNKTMDVLRQLVYITCLGIQNDEGDELLELCGTTGMSEPQQYWLTPAGGLEELPDA